MKLTEEINLGDECKDTITGMAGVAIGRCIYLYGCSQLLIQPKKLTGGVSAKPEWIDDQRIVLVKRRKPKVSKASISASGGPQNSPPERSGPQR